MLGNGRWRLRRAYDARLFGWGTRMAWKRKGNHYYYRRSKRVGRKVITQYFGRGAAAQAAAQVDALRRAERQAEQDHRQRWQHLDAQVAELNKTCWFLAKACLITDGFYCNDRHWRVRSHVRNQVPTIDLDRADLATIVDQANKGCPQALARLREVLDNDPDLWHRVADLSSHVETTLIDVICGGNALLRESLRKKCREMRESLVGTSPALLPDMLSHSVVVCWLQLEHLDACHPTPTGSDAQARFVLHHRESAQRRLTQALKTLRLVADMQLKHGDTPRLRIVG